MKKRLSVLFLILTLICSMVPPTMAAETADTAWKTIYVNPTGSDSGDGSQSNPFATIGRAQEEVRKYNKDMQGDIVVSLAPGRYEQLTNLDMRIADSGFNGYDVIYRGEDAHNMATISGAKEVKGTWTEGANGIWSVKADNLKFARELIVNDRIATRARSQKKISGNAHYKNEEFTHRHYGETKGALGFYVDKTKLGLYKNPEDIEFHWTTKFRSGSFHVDDIIQDPDNQNQVIAIMDRRVWREYTRGFQNDDQIHYSVGFIVENAYELLDEPGEFYFNKKTKVLSYIPREGEDMNTAEVLCPQGEQLFYIHGDGYYNRVHNIRFENVKFAHTTNYTLEESSLTGGQAEYHYSTYTPFFVGRTSVLVDWAEGIDFEECVFHALTTNALYFREGVFESEVIGNVFADLGANGFVAGHNYHEFPEEPKPHEGPVDAAWHAPWSSSYHYWPGTAYSYQALNTQRLDQLSMAGGSGWYSEPWAAEEGTLPWVKIEMEAAYAIETFEFSFPRASTEEERSNFEVLASNDRDFNEYDTLKVYEGPAELREVIPTDGKTYRYFMLRKTVPGPFCLNGVWAMSNDVISRGNLGAPGHCTIANNVFRRVALAKWATYPIMLHYTDTFNVVHNDIYDAPYTGISVGWNWAYPNDTAFDNNISYNRIDEVMTTASDGGGIYIFGEQWGTQIIGNFITNTTNDAPGLYFDSGHCGITADSNVIMNTGFPWNMNNPLGGTILRNHYTADNTAIMKNGKWITDLSPYPGIDWPTSFSYTDRPDEVARVMAEAGLEDEYVWLKERIPEADTQRINVKGIDATDGQYLISKFGMTAHTRMPDDIEVAEAMIANGTFGNLPWNFSHESGENMLYWIEQAEDGQSRSDDVRTGHRDEMLKLEDAIREANNSVYHPSYDEMLQMCDDLAKEAAKGNYPKAAVKEFDEEVAKVKATNPQTKGDKAVAANQLEKIYQKLYDTSYISELEAVVVRGAEAVMDREARTTTVKLPFGVEPKDLSPVYCASANSTIPADTTEFNHKTGIVKVPLKNKNTGKYSYWTVKYITNDDTSSQGRISAMPEDWMGGNINATLSNVAGVMTIEPWWEPTMYRKLMDGNMSFSINVPRTDTVEGIDIIFSSQSDDLAATIKEPKNSYYKLNLKNQYLTLYRVESGVATPHIQATDIYFGYGAYNDFDISVTDEHGLNRVIVKLNGTMLIDTLVDKPIGQEGYFGIMTKNMAVKIK